MERSRVRWRVSSNERNERENVPTALSWDQGTADCCGVVQRISGLDIANHDHRHDTSVLLHHVCESLLHGHHDMVHRSDSVRTCLLDIGFV